MGLTSEASKTIATVVESLKDSPSCLALVLLSGLFAVVSYYSLTSERHEMHERQMALIDKCIPSRDKN